MTPDPAPAVRRMKTYTGGQGYVYQYYFVGKRAALPEAAQGLAAEYIFDVTSDRKITFSVSVFVPQPAVEQWAAAHGRSLREAEEYAAAKMRLFQAFDDIENMMGEGRRLLIDFDALERLLGTLKVE